MSQAPLPAAIASMKYGRCSICGSDRTCQHPTLSRYVYCRSCRNRLTPGELCPNESQLYAAKRVLRPSQWEGDDDEVA